MTKAVFIAKAESAYDDQPGRYHFPRTYLRQVEAAKNDWIVYYEPRRPSADLNSSGGSQAYFATARLDSIEPDPVLPDHFYAFVEDYLEFDRKVPFKEGGHYFESALQKADGTTNRGAFGRSVRSMPTEEYDLILQAGFSDILGAEANVQQLMPGLAEEQLELDRPIVEKLTARPFRNEAFSRQVMTAYKNTCAITGLLIINGGGRSEAEAAHIRPVADKGPDTVRNGLALSRTVHWMFDRGLLSLDDDLTILQAGSSVPDTMGRLINPDGKLLRPPCPELCPHPQFLKYHRENVFKG